MSYFRFFPDVITVEGCVRCTVHSLSEGKIIHLDHNDSLIVKKLKKCSIEETESEYGSYKVMSFVDRMIAEALGTIYDNDVYMEHYLPHMPFELSGYLENPTVIDELSIEIYPLDLYHVNDESNQIVFQGCNGCIPSHRIIWDANYADRYFSSLNENLLSLENIEIKKVCFHTGEPERATETLPFIIRNLLEKHKRITFEYTVYAEKITEDFIKFISQYENTSIVIFARASSDTDTLKSLADLSQNYGLNAVVSLLILDINDIQAFPSAEKFYADSGIQLRTVELLKGMDRKVCSIKRNPERLEAPDSDSFFARGRYSMCRYGKIFIDCTGFIGSCFFETEQSMFEKGLFEFLEKNRHKELWEQPKRIFSPCSRCENRYCCIDCGLIEKLSDKDSEALIKSVCAYNPDSGIWEGDI